VVAEVAVMDHQEILLVVAVLEDFNQAQHL
jgi:hypothetical protein